MTAKEFIELKDKLIKNNAELQRLMEQIGIDEEVYTQSLAEMLGIYTIAPATTSNSTSVK